MLQAKRLEMFGRGLGASRIEATIKVSGDGKAGLSSGGTNEVEKLLIAVERFAGPVLGELRKETMLDGVPFRSSGGVVGDVSVRPWESASWDWSWVFQARQR